jgi:hypothetical protein
MMDRRRIIADALKQRSCKEDICGKLEKDGKLLVLDICGKPME